MKWFWQKRKREFTYDRFVSQLVGYAIFLFLFEILGYATLSIAIQQNQEVFEDWGFLNTITFALISVTYLLTILYLGAKGRLKGLSIAKITTGLTLNFFSVHLFFAWLYLAIYNVDHAAFSTQLTWIDPLLIATGIATTIGYGGVEPVGLLAKLAVIIHQMVSFVLVVFVIGWVVSLITEYSNRQAAPERQTKEPPK